MISAEAIKYIYPDTDFTKDVILQDDSDGKGVYIKEWNRAEPQPTQEELDIAQIAAEAQKAATQYISDRRSEYPSIEDQLDAIWTLLSYPTDVDALKVQTEIEDVRKKYPSKT